MRTTIILLAAAAFVSTSTLAQRDGLFRGSSVTEVHKLYGNSCPKRHEQCQVALAEISSLSLHNTDENPEPAFDGLTTIAQDPAVWSKIQKLRHMATNLQRHWTPDVRLPLSIRNTLRLAHELSIFLSETWENVSLTAPVHILERMATQPTSLHALAVANHVRDFLQRIIQTVMTLALVPDADSDCEIQAVTCEYHQMLLTVLSLLQEQDDMESRSSIYL